MDCVSDKISIKNLLFTKAIPNYILPVPVDGHKVYPCTDCGDKFMFESSYNDHVNRKSAKISYMCRHCSIPKVFYNRCNLLCHIRSHAFRTATINVTDLKVEQLPLSCFKTKPVLPESVKNSEKQTIVSESPRKPSFSSIVCFECKANITTTGVAYKDRANHFMQYTNEVFTCPVCLFALPSICALKIHLRIHLRCPPYYCPECGIHLRIKNVQYPYNHDCEGFKMMRATARLNCSVPNCSLFHPNDYKEHMRKNHLRKVYKCPFCVVACFNESTMNKHLKGHRTTAKALLFYQCDVCPSRYVLQNPKLNDNHLKSHINCTVYPCWACGASFKEVSLLMQHFIDDHNKNESVKIAINTILKEGTLQLSKPKRIYRVVKRCEQCTRSFTYKCKYEEIQILPVECPFKCRNGPKKSHATSENSQNIDITGLITCHLCQEKVSQDWGEIKKHYAKYHKTHKCLDAEILLTKMEIMEIKNNLAQKKFGKKSTIKSLQKVSKKTRNRRVNKSPTSIISISDTQSTSEDKLYTCSICGDQYEQKSTLENHIVTHRDPCMAYQCLECGQSFVVKPSFSKHLLLEHGIKDVEDYINNKQCYNENALMKQRRNTIEMEIPLAENQCRICRDMFDSPEDLEKHFRVHGMAFLMQNTSNKNTTT